MIEIEEGDSPTPRFFSYARLPLQVGRRSAGYTLDRQGVWDRHLVLSRDEEGWIVVTPHGDAAIFREGERLGPSARLKNGDSLELGSARLRIRISNSCQRSLWMLETFTWLGLLTLALAQLFLVLGF